MVFICFSVWAILSAVTESLISGDSLQIFFNPVLFVLLTVNRTDHSSFAQCEFLNTFVLFCPCLFPSCYFRDPHQCRQLNRISLSKAKSELPTIHCNLLLTYAVLVLQATDTQVMNQPPQKIRFKNKTIFGGGCYLFSGFLVSKVHAGHIFKLFFSSRKDRNSIFYKWNRKIIT